MSFTTTTKSQLVEILANDGKHYSVDDRKLHLDIILQCMSSALSQGKRVEVRGVFTFEMQKRPPRKARNPKTGASVDAPEKKHIACKIGKRLKEKVKHVRAEKSSKTN